MVGVLMTSTSGAGHVGALLPFAAAVTGAGGDVLIATSGAGAAAARIAGFGVIELGRAPASQRDHLFAAARREPEGNVNSRVVREVFAGVDARVALPGVLAACRRWRPDVIVHESCEFAAVLAAELTGVPRVRVAIGTGATEDVILRAAGAALDARRGEAGLRRDPGGAGTRIVPTFSLSPAALEDPAMPGPSATLRFRPASAPVGRFPDLWPGDERPLVHLTLGTVAPETDPFPMVYRAAVDALAALPVRVLVTVGRDADPGALGPLPPAARALGWVPQVDVLTQAVAVACHGGSGTVQLALSAGVPLALLPLFADQPHNARRVSALGAGVAVWGRPAAASGLGDAVAQVLADPSYRAAAERAAASIRALPPVETAVSVLRDLCTPRRTSRDSAPIGPGLDVVEHTSDDRVGSDLDDDR